MDATSRDLDAAIAALLEDAIADGACTGAAAAVGDAARGQRWFAGTLGHTAAPVTRSTRFDLASLTKPIATAMVAHTLVARGALSIDAAAARWVPIDPAISVRHLLGHASGLPAHVPLYERLWAGDRAGAPDARAALIAMAIATPIERAPGTGAVYSDLGYMILAALCERAADAPFETLVADALAPLALAATGFVALPSASPPAAPATEVCARRGVVAGVVHDENAHAGGGVAGHAGLFAPLDDVATFARAAALGPTRGLARVPAAHVAHAFATAAAPATSWRLGWDTPSTVPGVSHAGDAWPRATGVGHLGFTGTSMWLDWASGGYAVLLTNRTYPRRDRPAAARIREVRRGFGDLAWQWLAGEPVSYM